MAIEEREQNTRDDAEKDVNDGTMKVFALLPAFVLIAALMGAAYLLGPNWLVPIVVVAALCIGGYMLMRSGNRRARH